MIYFVDEDYGLYRSWVTYTEALGYEVKCIRFADEAFRLLSSVGAESVELVIVDVMLASDGTEERYSAERTDEYQQTGLALIQDLEACNEAVFPGRAALLTNTVTRRTLARAKAIADQHKIPLWKKADIGGGREFAQLVDSRVKALALR